MTCQEIDNIITLSDSVFSVCNDLSFLRTVCLLVSTMITPKLVDNFREIFVSDKPLVLSVIVLQAIWVRIQEFLCTDTGYPQDTCSFPSIIHIHDFAVS